MSGQSVRSLAADRRILGALKSGPKSAQEIATVLRREVWAAWSERHGYDFAWESDEEPLGARLLAYSEADEMGLPYVHAHEVYPRLRRLERREQARRIQLEGHRPILWVLADTEQETASNQESDGATKPEARDV